MDRTQADDDRPDKAESAVSDEDRERELEHKLDRMAPSRRAVWPKDDRRSSERLARPRRGGARPARRAEERAEREPREERDQPFG